MKLVIGIVVVVVIVVGGLIVLNQDGPAQNESGSRSASSGESGKLDIIPNVSVKNESGNSVDIHDVVLGKPALINSWATWCPFCVDELPDFARIQEEFGDEVQVVAVNRRESESKVSSYLQDLGVAGKMTYLSDGVDSWYRAIGGFSMPETLFVNSDGEIVLHKRGPLTFEDTKRIIQQQLLNN